MVLQPDDLACVNRCSEMYNSSKPCHCDSVCISAGDCKPPAPRCTWAMLTGILGCNDFTTACLHAPKLSTASKQAELDDTTASTKPNAAPPALAALVLSATVTCANRCGENYDSSRPCHCDTGCSAVGDCRHLAAAHCTATWLISLAL